MAEPKKRTNRSKRNMRRMHHKTAIPAIVFCPNCHTAMRKHNICQKCGQYRGTKILNVEESVKIKVEDNKTTNG